jgi:hypothetical protein
LWGRLPNLRTDCQSVHPGAARTNEATTSEHRTMDSPKFLRQGGVGFSPQRRLQPASTCFPEACRHPGLPLKNLHPKGTELFEILTFNSSIE